MNGPAELARGELEAALSSLTAKRRRFVALYPESWDAAKAARGAGYSERTARSQGERLLRVPAVRRAIALQERALATRAELTAERVLELTRDLAEANITDVASWSEEGVRLRPSAALNVGQARGIAAVREDQHGCLQVTLDTGARRMAIDRLGQVMRLWGPRVAETEDPIEALTDEELDARIQELAG